MSRHDTVGSHKTSIRTDKGVTHVQYHNTDVVSFNATGVVLRTGGWWSNTTKLRMNQAANQFGLGFGVFQKDHEWYVTIGDNEPVMMVGEMFAFRRDDGRIILNGNSAPKVGDILNSDGTVCETPETANA